MKTIKNTLDVGHGIKLTVERPFTEADAFAEFQAGIQALGGQASRGASHDEIIVSGASVTEVVKLSQKYAETVAELSGSTGSASGHVGFGIGLPFGFPSFAHIPSDEQVLKNVMDMLAKGEPGVLRSPTGRRATGPAVQSIKSKPAPKRVAQVAPNALSTWEFQSNYLQRMYGQTVHLVGQHYRGKLDQEVLGWKRSGNMALLVAEPDNPVDFNAIMVLMWNDQTKHWHHVGYVRATEAAVLRGKWTGDHKNVMVARISTVPSNSDGHRGGRNIELTLTGEVRTYPGYQV